MADAGAADRGMSSVVGKAMEATIVVLYVGLVAATLYGGAVAEYRGAAGAEVAERTLADAAADVEAAVPPTARAASVRLAVDLPAIIAGSEEYKPLERIATSKSVGTIFAPTGERETDD